MQWIRVAVVAVAAAFSLHCRAAAEPLQLHRRAIRPLALTVEMRAHSAVYETPEETGATIVLRDGLPVGPWKTCEGRLGQPLARCFVVDEFVDRAEFDVAFPSSLDADDFTVTAAAVQTKDKRVNPVVDNLVFDREESTAAFAVLYKCSQSHTLHDDSSIDIIRLTFGLKDVTNVAVNLYWVKFCSGGAASAATKIEIGHLVRGFSDVISAVPSTSTTTKYIAGVTDASSLVYLSVSAPGAGPQAFEKPVLKSSNSLINAAVLADQDGGILRHGRRTVLDIAYECYTEDFVTANITAAVPIPPFKPLQLTWLKTCGRLSVPRGLTIGSENYNSTDVLSVDGVFGSSFSTETASLDDLYTLPIDRYQQEFYLVNHGSRPMMVQAVIVTAVNSSVVFPRIREPTIFDFDSQLFKTAHSFFYIRQGTQERMAPSEKRRLRLEFPCRAKGVSRIEIEIQFLQAPAKFSLVKYCRAPEARQVESVWTAQSAAMFFSSFVLVCVGIARRASHWHQRKMVFHCTSGQF